VIDDDQQRVVLDPGPRPLAERHEHREAAEVLLPDELAVHRVGVEAREPKKA